MAVVKLKGTNHQFMRIITVVESIGENFFKLSKDAGMLCHVCSKYRSKKEGDIIKVICLKVLFLVRLMFTMTVQERLE